MTAILKRIPWWAWLALILTAAFAIQEHRIRSLHARLDAAKLDDLGAERAAISKEREALAADRSSVLRSIESLKLESAKVEARVRALDADLSRATTAGQRLVNEGTVDETVAALRAAGLKSARRAK